MEKHMSGKIDVANVGPDKTYEGADPKPFTVEGGGV
jgi:hypothetical protein